MYTVILRLRYLDLIVRGLSGLVFDSDDEAAWNQI